MLVAFEFTNSHPSNFFICHADDGALFTNPPPRPKRGEWNNALFPLYTHVFEMGQEDLNRVWSNKNDYTLEQMQTEFNLLTVLECDWANGYAINPYGFIDSREAVFLDEEPPSYVVMSEPHNTLKKPKWTGVEWVEGYVEEVVEPSEIDVLKQEIQTLKQEIEQLKTNAE